MARGGKRGGGKRGNFGGKKRKRGSNFVDSLSKRQKSDLKQFGEAHPADERDTCNNQRYKKVRDEAEVEPEVPEESSSSEESEDEGQQAYQELIATCAEEVTENKDAEAYEEDDEFELDDEDDDDSKETAANLGGEAIEKSNESEDDEIVYDDSGKDAEEIQLDDPFAIHFEEEIEEKTAEERLQSKPWNKEEIRVPFLGKGLSYSCQSEVHTPTKVTYEKKKLRDLHVKLSLCNNVKETNTKFCQVELSKSESLTPFQHCLFCHMNSYQDICFSDRTHLNAEEIRMSYCLHALNHILKTRSRVIGHNSKLKAKENSTLEDYRDQGLTRPKVLIIVPFRDAALKIVKMMTRLLMSEDQTFVSNKKRFTDEFGIEEDVKKGLKPADFEDTFNGNIDDHFRIGIGIAKKSLKLYTEFYQSDLIIASPLGMRTIIGAEGEEERDFDFLSSIELLVFDQMDVFLMQNWDHIQHLMKHMHLQPKESHGVDFSRIRMWTLNGWSSVYRQTMIFSNLATPEINCVFNKYCHNYAGKVLIQKANTKGTICQIVTQLPQVFHKVSVANIAEAADNRFSFFKSKILPEHKDQLMVKTLVFISSYFDFVRIRNYFQKEELDMVHISEYSKDKHVVRARGLFYHKKIHFMLYTERFHFFRRYKIRGIKHLIFYDLPYYPHFYSEICNMLQDSKDKAANKNLTCAVIYTKYDVNRLAGVVGTDRAAHMVNSDKQVHMFVTGEDS